MYYYQRADRDLQSDNEYRKNGFQEQFNLIRNQLGTEQAKILDFGCSEGPLLSYFLRELHSKYELFGYEPAPIELPEPVRKLSTINAIKAESQVKKFDLVILSHVLEHLLTFDLLELFFEILSEDGLLYIEVPNANRYLDQNRASNFYYIDRLHLNHFTLASICKLLEQFNFKIKNAMEYNFTYKDDLPYPCLATFFRRNSGLSEFEKYILESKTNIELKMKCFAGKKVGIYGLGDYFMKMKSLGLFDECEIAFGIDRNHSLKSNFEFEVFEDIDELKKSSINLREITIIVCASWGTQEILDKLNLIPDITIEVIA
jgi:2-polyprenyl-3-methyl-5-hydroxy-6-metoxy-1,4-benzoquinol methylase